MDPVDLSVIAAHEAGHVVMRWLMGLPHRTPTDVRKGKAAIVQVEALTAKGESIHASLHQQAQRAAVSTKAGRVSTNRLLARLRHVYVWAIEHDLIETSPFTKGTVSVIKLDRKAESSRSRRLEDGENDRLLAHAGPHLRACIEVTRETGMRRGEILGVQWQHVKVSQGISSSYRRTSRRPGSAASS